MSSLRLSLYILSILTTILACGCGGGSGSTTQNTPKGGFTVTGKITLSDGTPLAGVPIKLFKTTYSIYSTSGFFTTRNSQGTESISLASLPADSQLTLADGSYTFSNITSGNYMIKPESAMYLFKWKLIPTRNSIGILTLTDSAMAYLYDPDGRGNQLSSDRTVIFNSVPPSTLTGNIFQEQNLEASLPGGAVN